MHVEALTQFHSFGRCRDAKGDEFTKQFAPLHRNQCMFKCANTTGCLGFETGRCSKKKCWMLFDNGNHLPITHSYPDINIFCYKRINGTTWEPLLPPNGTRVPTVSPTSSPYYEFIEYETNFNKCFFLNKKQCKSKKSECTYSKKSCFPNSKEPSFLFYNCMGKSWDICNEEAGCFWDRKRQFCALITPENKPSECYDFNTKKECKIYRKTCKYSRKFKCIPK